MKTLGESCSFCILTLDLGRSEDADRTSAGQRRARRRDQGAGPNRRVEDRAGDANLAGQIAGQGEVIPRIGNRFDDRPQRRIGPDGETHVGVAITGSSACSLSGSVIGDEGDDEYDCKQESSDHEHHGPKR